MTNFPDLYTEAIKPDIIHETATGTYIGWFDRGRNYNRSLPPEEQAIWRIRFVEQNDGITRIIYPDGRDEFEFIWNNRESFSYNYRK